MKKYVFITVVLFLALVLRLLYIGDPLWYDEACSWFSARQMFPLGIMDNLLHLDLQHTPIYFFLLHFWMKLFGESETAMRVLSLLFGLGSIPLVYSFANKISNKQVALISSLIAAISPVMVIFSVEVRMYSLVTFLVLLSLNYLVDFEHNGKNFRKLIGSNILIPYVFTGGIIFNISLLWCYGYYLFKNNKDKFKQYIKGAIVESVALIPFWVLIVYYAMQRKSFVIAHEGELKFIQIIDIIRNLFGVNVSENIYWPSENYSLTFAFAIFVILPCVYFVYSFIKDLKESGKFEACLHYIGITIFALFIFASFLKVNVLTARYVLYLYPLVLVLCVLGMFKVFSTKHRTIFLTLFILFSTIFSFQYSKTFEQVKHLAFKDVANEVQKLELNTDDVVLMPFGSDAPYYFKALVMPRVYNFDFHKETRNPYNNRFYDKEQQKSMTGKNKFKTVFDSIHPDYIISENYYNDFTNKVSSTVPKDRYVLLALYGSDNNYVIPIDKLKTNIKNVQDVESNLLGVLFNKYLSDTFFILNLDFNLIKSYNRGNYTYYLFQKR